MCLLTAMVPTAFAAAPSAPTATAVRIPADSITLDGRLNEPAWQHAQAITLTQQDPHPGAPTPYKTEVRVLVDAQHIYFGFTNIDPHPDQIAVHTLQRDNDQSNDDHISIVLDTFGGRRLGYWFQVNAGGARNDGLDVNDNTDSNWNGIWDAAVARTPNGWTVEVVISTQSLQFGTNLDAWGMNIGRYVPRDQLSLQWSGISLNADLFDLQRAGTLTGVAGLKQGMGLEIQPYALVRYNSAPGTGRSGDVGADIKYNFTPQMEGILTINPDFAEAEAEHGQVNLSRFSLFFPEKRPFFLEGSNLFEFGSNLNIGDDANLSTEFIPYFSRNIGLVNGRIVPIDEGAKLIGHSGPFSVGALDVETGSSSAAPATNLAVARTAYDVNDNLRVGTLFTHGDPTGLTDNTFAGTDAVWHTSQFAGDKNLTLSGWYAHSYGDLKPGEADGYGAGVEYPNDLWHALLRVNQFGDALDPALGFLPRPGTRQYLGYAVYGPRPQGGAFDWVRQFQLGAEYIQVDGLDGHPQSKELALIPLRFTTDAGYYFSLVPVSEYETLDKPFTVASNVTIPVGQYRFNQYNVQFNTPQSQPLVIYANASGGDFYTGTIRSESVEIDWTAPGGKLQLGVSNGNDFGHLPQGNFIIRLTQVNAAYSFTPNLALTSFVQYDNITHTTGINARLQWIIQPGRELFLVFNHGIEPQLADLNRAPPTGNAIILKLRWDFDW